MRFMLVIFSLTPFISNAGLEIVLQSAACLYGLKGYHFACEHVCICACVRASMHGLSHLKALDNESSMTDSLFRALITMPVSIPAPRKQSQRMI